MRFCPKVKTAWLSHYTFSRQLPSRDGGRFENLGGVGGTVYWSGVFVDISANLSKIQNCLAVSIFEKIIKQRRGKVWQFLGHSDLSRSFIGICNNSSQLYQKNFWWPTNVCKPAGFDKDLLKWVIHSMKNYIDWTQLCVSKVWTFWEAHKKLRNLSHAFDIYLVNVESMRKIFSNFVFFSESPNFK